MAEVQTKVLELVEGVAYIPRKGDVVIPFDASFWDIFRYVQSQCGRTLESFRIEAQRYIDGQKNTG